MPDTQWTREEIVEIIKDSVKNIFKSRFLGDTPTDALQLVNKKYVDEHGGGAGGSNRDIQFNDNGILAGDSTLKFLINTGVPEVQLNSGLGQLDLQLDTFNATLAEVGGASFGSMSIIADAAVSLFSALTPTNKVVADADEVRLEANGAKFRTLPDGRNVSQATALVLEDSGETTFAYRKVGKLLTTDNIYTAVPSVFPTISNSAGYIRARVIGRRTGGSSGTVNDMIVAEIVQGVKNSAGTVTLNGSLTYVFFYQDTATPNAQFVVNGTNVELQVRGDTNNNYSWGYEMWYMNVQT